MTTLGMIRPPNIISEIKYHFSLFHLPYIFRRSKAEWRRILTYVFNIAIRKVVVFWGIAYAGGAYLISFLHGFKVIRPTIGRPHTYREKLICKSLDSLRFWQSKFLFRTGVHRVIFFKLK